MTGRALIGVIALILTALLASLAGVTLLYTGTAAACLPLPGGQTSSASGAAWSATGDWDTEQVTNAATIVAVGLAREVPSRGWIIAVATAMRESGLRNLAGGDRDSLGLFQQRPSQGWGTTEEISDPAHAAGAFYDALLQVDGWQTMALTDAAQAVQRSAYPDAYAQWEDDATTLVTAITDGLAVCAWTQPVHAAVVSGFRTTDRPTHDGVDLAAARGTPVVAASNGTVARVRCNAIDTRTGADWGCDRDGDPTLTRGCGWYLDLHHPDGVITRYCHLDAQPIVAVGDTVTTGQTIGHVGSTGHSSGPHLHLEVHLNGDETSSGATDPEPFLAERGAPLGQ